MLKMSTTLKNSTMTKIFLETEAEYDLVKSRGYEPLLPNKHFKLDIRLRERIQKRLFGHCSIGRGSDIMAANERFFRWVWKHKPHYCEECMKPLNGYSAVYCSHILTRGSHPEMAHDPRNINILCFEHHNQWENQTTRKKMRIYNSNKIRIKELKDDYIGRNLERDKGV